MIYDKQKFLRKTIYTLSAAFLPVIVLSFVLLICGIYPFGHKSILTYDLRSQYVDFYAELRNILSGGGNLFYSFSRAFGGDFFTLFSYYLISPFNIILIFFNESDIVSALTFIYYLKIVSASLACFFYLSKSRLFRLHPIFSLILSLVYSFCGFAVMYAQNLIWLDALWLLPLSSLSLEILVRKKSVLPFLIITASCFIINFYTAIPIFAFSCLYYFAFILTEKKINESLIISSVRFIYSAGCGILISCPIVYPACCKLAETKLSENNIILKLVSIDTLPAFIFAALVLLALAVLLSALFLFFNRNKTFAEKTVSNRIYVIIFCSLTALFIACSLLSPEEFTATAKKILPFVFDKDTPQLYSSSAALLLFIILLIRTVKHKKYSTLIILSLIAAVSVPLVCKPLDILLHAGQNPISFPARYTYIFTFTLIIASAYLLSELPENFFRQALPFSVAVLAVIICISELTANACLGFKYNEKVYYLYYDKNSYDTFISETSDALAYTESETLSRKEKSFYRYLNDSLSLGYSGLSHYSSMYNTRLISLCSKLGYAVSPYWSSYFGSTPVLDSIFDIEYLLDLNDKDFASRHYIKIAGKSYAEDLYKNENSTDLISVYRNDAHLALAFAADKNFLTFEANGKNPFTVQNMFISALKGENVILFEDAEISSASLSNMEISDGIYIKQQDDGFIDFYITSKHEGSVFLYLDSPDMLPCEVKLNGESISDYKASQAGVCYTLYLGEYEIGKDFTLSLYPKDQTLRINNMYISVLNPDYREIISDIEQGRTSYEIEENSLSIKTSTAEETVLFTSIPYEKGWEAEIDGIKADISIGAEAFICLNLPAGEHTVSLSYTPPGLMYGFILGFAGFILAAIPAFIRYKIKE